MLGIASLALLGLVMVANLTGTWGWEVAAFRDGPVRLSLPLARKNVGFTYESKVKASFRIARSGSDAASWVRFGAGDGSVACSPKGETLAGVPIENSRPDCREQVDVECQSGDKDDLRQIVLTWEVRPADGAPKDCEATRAQDAPLVLLAVEAGGDASERRLLRDTVPLRGLVVGGSAVSAEACRSNPGGDTCRAGGELLPLHRPVRLVGARATVLGWIENVVERWITPGILWSMTIVSLALLGGVLWALFLVYWQDRRKEAEVAYTTRDSRYRLLHPDDLHIGLRESLAFFRVTGPGLGFALTVMELVLAFRPDVFGAHDLVRFTGSVSDALVATLLGLGIRLGAETIGRLHEYRVRLVASQNGGYWPKSETTNVAGRTAT